MSNRTQDVLARALAESSPEGAARTLERLDAAAAAGVLAALPADLAARVVRGFAPHSAAAILGKLTPEQTRSLLEAMTPRQAVEVLHHVDPERREVMVQGLPEEAAKSLRQLLSYPAETAAGMMEPQVVSIPDDVTVQEAISLIRRAPRQSVHYLYVTDRERKLVGILGTRDLLLASPRDAVKSIMMPDVAHVPATMDREEVANLMRVKRYVALPVIDGEGHLLGVVRHDEVLEAAQDEAFEDLQKMVGAGGDERALAPPGVAVRKRLPWLVVNLATAFLASAVIALFESALAQVAALAVLMPIVAGQGGNTGAQALAVTIRGLALREFGAGLPWRVLFKELAAGFVNGTAVAALTSGAVWLWQGSAGLALVIGLSMLVTMTIASLSGAGIPLLLHALKFDPAQSSSIFMTTVTDVVGFASFLGLALLLMKLLV
jgi:magnesium transporter